MAAQDSALHVLNRLAYGPRPGLVEEIAATGVRSWIEAQLQGVPDAALAARESEFEILAKDTEALARLFVAAQRERRERQRAAQEMTAPPGENDSMETSPRRAERERSEQEDDFDALRGQLQQLALVRAVFSENQLREVLADFWFNHFNVFLGKGADRYLVPGYVETVIRPQVLGTFAELLVATAQSPAMLFYLDNVQSVAQGAKPPRLARAEQRAARGRLSEEQTQRLEEVRSRQPKGINENYARELLELHTLGVDGGYTQQDVVDVARIFTGWGMEQPDEGAGFAFHAWAHDTGVKRVLGVDFPAGGGQEEGLRLLHLLANHPATMHHVSRQLVTRLVSDAPPDGCVDAAVRAWQQSGGDLRAIVRAIVGSPEFWSAPHVGGKFKSPLEFVASSLRAVAADVDDTPRLARAVASLGQPLYLQPVPTGYAETQEDWLNSGSLLQRMNLAVALAAGRLPGARVQLDDIVPAGRDPEALVAAVDARILSGSMSENTRRVILEQIRAVDDPAQARALAVGLALGGPEFQRQ